MLKRKNDRQPPQRLEEECYPNDYWLDEEDGGEDTPDPAVSSKPVSGRLHSEPMVVRDNFFEARIRIFHVLFRH